MTPNNIDLTPSRVDGLAFQSGPEEVLEAAEEDQSRNMVGTPKIQTIGSKIVVKELQRRGLDFERIVRAAGLEMRVLKRDEAWIPYPKYAALVELGAHETGDEYFGLHLVKQVDPRDLGALGYVGLSSKTLGDAILNLQRYLATITESSVITFSVSDDLVCITHTPAHASYLGYRHAMELALATFVKCYQFFTTRKIRPVEVRFAHRYAGDSSEHEKVFGCPVKFSCKQSQVILDRADIATPIKTADDKLLRILTTHCEDILERRAANKPEQMVKLEKLIVDLFPTGRAKAKVVATELGMSERSLVRYLSEHGTSFSEVVSQLRYDLSLKYLHSSELNLAQVAFLLGYANQSAFSTAFRRTTGVTPREFRTT